MPSTLFNHLLRWWLICILRLDVETRLLGDNSMERD